MTLFLVLCWGSDCSSTYSSSNGTAVRKELWGLDCWWCVCTKGSVGEVLLKDPSRFIFHIHINLGQPERAITSIWLGTHLGTTKGIYVHHSSKEELARRVSEKSGEMQFNFQSTTPIGKECWWSLKRRLINFKVIQGDVNLIPFLLCLHSLIK